MRFFVLAFVLVALNASAFDSAEWLGKRALLAREAERLEAAYTACVARLDHPAEDVKVPLACNPDGSIKTVVEAKRAQIFVAKGLVWAEGVTLRDYATNGTLTAAVDADNCVIDRTVKACWANGHARASQDGTTLDGSRVYLSSEEQYFSVHSNAVLVSSKFGLKKTAGTNVVTRVAARRADYDRLAGVVMLEGDVQLDDPEYHMTAGQAYVFLEGTNGLKRVVALQGVSVTSGTRAGTCDRAVYEQMDDRLTLYAADGASVPAKLVDHGARKGELAGSKITFRPGSEQVEIENAVIHVETGHGGGILDALGGRQ